MNNRIIKIFCVTALTASLILSSTVSIGYGQNRQEWQGQSQGQEKNWHHERRHGGGSSVYIGVSPGLYYRNSYYYNQPYNYQQCGWVVTQYDFSGNAVTEQWVCQ